MTKMFLSYTHLKKTSSVQSPGLSFVSVGEGDIRTIKVNGADYEIRYEVLQSFTYKSEVEEENSDESDGDRMQKMNASSSAV